MNKKLQEELCEQMQATGKCDGFDCTVCEHMMALLMTTLELLQNKLNK